MKTSNKTNHISRRDFLRISSEILAAAGIGASGIFGSRPQKAYASGNLQYEDLPELVIAQDFDLDTLDSNLTAASGSVPYILGHIQDGLRRPKYGGGYTLQLVDHLELVDDLTYLLHLKQGIKFQDGSDFNADVVVANFDRYADPATGTVQGGEGFTVYYKSWEAVDEYTVKLVTQDLLADVLNYLGEGNLMHSKKQLEERPESLQYEVIGTGPYKFVEWIPGERFVVEINPDYWGDKPHFSKITWRPVLEAATRVVELKTGRADIITNLPLEFINDIENTKGLKILKETGNMSSYIQFNCEKPPFNDKRVRQAMNYAIDRDSIVNYVMQGYGEPQVTFLNPSHDGYDPDLKPYPYDPEKAKELLAEAGYADGFTFTLAAPTDRYQKGKEICEAVAAQLEKIGVHAILEFSEFSSYIQRFVTRPVTFDAGLIGYGNSPAMWEIASSAYSRVPQAGYMSWLNEEFDDKFEKAKTIFDDKERDLAIRELRQILYDDPPFMYVVQPLSVFAMKENIQNFKLWPDMGYWLLEGGGCYKE